MVDLPGTCVLGEGLFSVEYPSGYKFTCVGELGVEPLNGEAQVYVVLGQDLEINKQLMKAESVALLDPRAVVRDLLEGEVAYHPRLWFRYLPKTFRTWLAENRSWAPWSLIQKV